MSGGSEIANEREPDFDDVKIPGTVRKESIVEEDDEEISEGEADLGSDVENKENEDDYGAKGEKKEFINFLDDIEKDLFGDVEEGGEDANQRAEAEREYNPADSVEDLSEEEDNGAALKALQQRTRDKEAREQEMDQDMSEESSEEEEVQVDISAQIKKALVPLLNRLSDGNMSPIFQEVHELATQFNTTGHSSQYAEVYCELFLSSCVRQQLSNSVILSVNCLFVAAQHRTLGHKFFAPFLSNIYAEIEKAHEEAKESTHAASLLKNCITVLTHFYMFGSLTHTFIFDVINWLVKSFSEKDVEVLLYMLHNVGGSLRGDSPELILAVIDECDQKYNTL